MGWYDYDLGGYVNEYTVSLTLTMGSSTATIQETVVAKDRDTAIAKAAKKLSNFYYDWQLIDAEASTKYDGD